MKKTEWTIKNGPSRMDNPEKLATLGIQDTEQKTSKKQKQKQNKNHNTQKAKKMNNTDPTKNAHAKVKHFLPLIKIPQCYPYSQYVLDTKTCTLLQTTGGKNGQNIGFNTECRT